MIERWTGVKDLVVALKTPDIRVTQRAIDQIGEELDVLIGDWRYLDPEFGEHCTMQREILGARKQVGSMAVSLAGGLNK